LAQLGHPQPHFAADAFDHCVTAYNGPNAAVVVVYGFFKGAFPMKACKRGAFTLIELLVVIAIIAILAAILFPVFAKARARANSTACLSNMKQIGIALYTYLNDYDECYPVLRRVNVPVPYTWRESLAPYAKSKDVFACPANPDAKKYPKTTAEGGTLPISYALNGSLFGSLNGDINVFRVVKMSQIKEPSNSLFVTESRHPSAELGVWLVGLYMYQAQKQGYFFHHSGRMNMVLCDTSARSMKLAQTIVPDDYWHDPRMPMPTLADRQAVADTIIQEYR
jgi:prepilin-type N-terminal cleavage/methylation domain-containing protein